MVESKKIDNENLLRLDLRCNMNCSFCNIHNSNEFFLSKEEMIRKIISLNNEENITITGGEPTLDLNLINYIKFAKKNNIKNIILQSNGTLFSSKIFTKKMADAGLSRVFLSFHSYDKEIFEKITRLKGGYDLVLKGIENLLENDIGVVVNIVATKLNYKEILETIKFLINKFPKLKVQADEKDLVLFSLSTVQPHGNALINQKEIVPKLSDVSSYLISAMKFCVENNLRFTNPGCGVPFCFVKGYEKYSAEFSGINKEILITQKDKVKSDKCKNCKYDNFCQGIWKKYVNIYGFDEIIPFEK